MVSVNLESDSWARSGRFGQAALAGWPRNRERPPFPSWDYALAATCAWDQISAIEQNPVTAAAVRPWWCRWRVGRSTRLR